MHIFAEVRIKIPGIEADSQPEAIKKAEERVNLCDLFERKHPTPDIEYIEWNERITNYLVDEDEDNECENSTYYKHDGITPDDDFYKRTAEEKPGPTFILTPVSPEKCELEGPYECPTCRGHVMLDATFLDQVTEKTRCPYCGERVEVPAAS